MWAHIMWAQPPPGHGIPKARTNSVKLITVIRARERKRAGTSSLSGRSSIRLPPAARAALGKSPTGSSWTAALMAHGQCYGRRAIPPFLTTATALQSVPIPKGAPRRSVRQGQGTILFMRLIPGLQQVVSPRYPASTGPTRAAPSPCRYA